MIILIGTEDSKRTLFFRKAAEQRKVSFRFIDWKDIEEISAEQFQGAVVKIDPPSYQFVRLQDMQVSLGKYQEFLEELQGMGCQFLNSPKGILQTLDKRFAKEILMENEVSVTEMFSEKPDTVQQLLDIMKKYRAYSVFVKPEYFSGAAGVVALRQQPATGKMVAYTSCKLVDSEMLPIADGEAVKPEMLAEEGKRSIVDDEDVKSEILSKKPMARQEEVCLCNTKTLYRMENPQEIFALLEKLLKLGVIVERWHPKDIFQGKSYDLRVVYQFGRIEYIVVRQSNGPITNLHLNNQAGNIESLGFSKDKLKELEKLCGKAMSYFPELSMAGIDVMLDKGSRKPRIIEINGQGDLIYQDIYGENCIYGKQIEELCKSIPCCK